MTCVLTYNSCTGFSAESGCTHNSLSEEYDFQWINSAIEPRTGKSACPPTPFKVEFGTNEKSIKLDTCLVCDQNEPKCLKELDKPVTLKGVKRKLSLCESDEIYVPTKRISPFLNTPQELKEEKKRILKISIQKLQAIEDAELFLRRSVLINNTMKRMQSELSKDKVRQRSLSAYNRRKRRQQLEYDILSNDCLSKSFLFDDPFLGGDKITDDMTDTLMNNLANKLGVSVKDKDKASNNLVSGQVPREDNICISEHIVNSGDTEVLNRNELTSANQTMSGIGTSSSNDFRQMSSPAKHMAKAYETKESFCDTYLESGFENKGVFDDSFASDEQSYLHNHDLLRETENDKESCIGCPKSSDHSINADKHKIDAPCIGKDIIGTNSAKDIKHALHGLSDSDGSISETCPTDIIRHCCEA